MARESFRIEGVKGTLETLKQLPPEIVSKNGGPVRSALRKASKLILDQAKTNVEGIIAEPNVDGRFVSTGLALKSLRIKRIRPLYGQKGEAFIVAVRRKKYEGRTIQRLTKRGTKGKAKPLYTNDVLFMLEHGTERRIPMPWMSTAFDMKKSEALSVFTTELPKLVARIVKRLAKQNAGRK